MKRVLSVALVLAFLGGCSGADDEPARVERKVTGLNAALEPVVSGNTAFAWDLYGQVRATPGNLFLSPFSISAALGMTYAGAAGSTAAQMQDVLHVGDDDSGFHHAFGSLVRDLSGDKPGRAYQLYVANRLFGSQGLSFGTDFLSVAEEDYGAGAEQVPFTTDLAAAIDRVNAWVSEQTQDKIPTLLADVDTPAVTVLANGIYFKAFWAARFDPSNTSPVDFTRSDGTLVRVDMMSASKMVARLARTAQYELIELDYEDHEVSLVVALPLLNVTLDQVEASLVSSGLDAALADAAEVHDVTVHLPKFQFRCRFDLVPKLKNLGMVDAFGAAADFGGIFAGAFLSRVDHEAYVQFDEQGTEAAAATASTMTLGISSTFNADHAFVFAIRDKLTRSLLFLGRVNDPTTG